MIDYKKAWETLKDLVEMQQDLHEADIKMYREDRKKPVRKRIWSSHKLCEECSVAKKAEMCRMLLRMERLEKEYGKDNV